MSRRRQWLGSIAFTAYLFVSVVPYSCWVVLSAPFTSRDYAWRIARAWARTVLAALARLCRLSYRVEGTENLRRRDAVEDRVFGYHHRIVVDVAPKQQ